MTDLQNRPNSLVDNYDAIVKLLATYGPVELNAVREKAFREYSEFGLPTTKDEEFKYVSLRLLEEGKFEPAYGATVTRHEVEQLPLGKMDSATVSFVNGQYAPEISREQTLPGGAFAGSLEDGFTIYEDKILEHLGKVATLKGKLGTTNDERFVYLNTAYLGEGAFVYVPKGVVLEHPIHIQYLFKADHGPLVSHPRTLIVLEEGAQAKVVESYIGLDGVVFTNAVTEVFMGIHSILEHDRFQQEGPDSVHIATTAVHQDASSTFTSSNVSFGARIARNDLNVWLNGEHTETWLNGAYVAFGEQVVDNHTRIDHAKPNCNSFEVYKGVLGGKATGIFNGKIFVYEDAQKTDAKQTNQAILLSPTATINTKPQLEIFADDVKCTHGATIGQLRDEALFYLRARGIPKDQAIGLLVYAFAAEVIEKITVTEAREALEKTLFARLSESQNLPEPLEE